MKEVLRCLLLVVIFAFMSVVFILATPEQMAESFNKAFMGSGEYRVTTWTVTVMWFVRFSTVIGTIVIIVQGIRLAIRNKRWNNYEKSKGGTK